MPAAYTTLTLTDGTTTANLVDNTNFQLLDDSYAPAVSSRRLSRQAGQSPYEDVIEEITLTVRGATGAACLANIATLTYLLDQADQFRDGDLVDPVTLTCQPQGSALTNPVTAMVLGRPPGAVSWMNLPVSFNDRLNIFEVAPLTLSFVRSGLWYGDLDEPSAAGAAANPFLQQVTMGASITIPGPTLIQITGFGGDSTDLTESYLFVASDNAKSANAIQIIEGETGSPDAGGPTLTSTADASANARGGSVGRISAASITDYEGISFLLSNPVDDKRAYILMAARNNTSGAVWYVYGASKGSSGQDGSPTGVQTITSTTPVIVPLGICYNSENHASLRLYVKCSTASGSPTLDIDYLAVLGRDFQNNYVVHIIPGSGVNTIDNFTIDPAELTAISPIVQAEDNTTLPADYPLGYDGDTWIATNSNLVSVMWFATRGTYWRWSDSLNAVLSNNLTIKRRPGYLTPQ